MPITPMLAARAMVDAHKNTSRLTRSLAATAVAILVAGQLVAAVHVHPTALANAPSGALGATDGICVVCLLHFHAPAASHVVPAVVRPAEVRAGRVTPAVLAPVCREIRTSQGRSPPVSL
jgi:hypothetical protein